MTVNGPLTPAQRSSVACAHTRRARGGPCCRLAPDSRQRRTANGGEWAGGSSRLRRSRAGLGMQLSSWQKRHVIRIFLTHHSSRAGVAQDFASQPQGGHLMNSPLSGEVVAGAAAPSSSSLDLAQRFPIVAWCVGGRWGASAAQRP